MSSNQDLWKILTGQSSLREPVSHVNHAPPPPMMLPPTHTQELVQAEICSDKALAKLGHGIGHYTPPRYCTHTPHHGIGHYTPPSYCTHTHHTMV